MSRPSSTTGRCRSLPSVMRCMISSTLSCRLQVITLRVMTSATWRVESGAAACAKHTHNVTLGNNSDNHVVQVRHNQRSNAVVR